VREKDLEKANLNSEWMEERVSEEPFEPQEHWHEEPAEEIKVTYTPDEACKEQSQGWVERLTIEINSRGPKAKDSQIAKERLWHSKIFALGNSITHL
ncbi:hypothetical protein A2U01_0060788, partial [Trifolium medium]|nr:hypothetical protein [Trifolium medium]